MPYKIRDVIKMIETDGWFLSRQTGSHRQYKHATKKGTVTIACHQLSKDVPPKTFSSIIKQAQIEE